MELGEESVWAGLVACGFVRNEEGKREGCMEEEIKVCRGSERTPSSYPVGFGSNGIPCASYSLSECQNDVVSLLGLLGQ